jgi:hypothetical protein
METPRRTIPGWYANMYADNAILLSVGNKDSGQVVLRLTPDDVQYLRSMGIWI